MIEMTPQKALETFRDRVRWMWSQGDYTLIAPLLQPCADEVADAIPLRPGNEVLDVAAGTGNFATAAAARGAHVTAIDLTPQMLELGSARTRGVTPPITWREADAEALPFADATFDAVASVFGAMFAPGHERVAAEMFRVVKPGGMVAVANYAPSGFLADLRDLLAKYSPPPPAPLPDPFKWGDPEELRRRIGRWTDEVEVVSKTMTWEFESAAAWLDFWERANAPHVAIKAMLPAERYSALAAEALALAKGRRRDDEPVVLTSSWTMAIACRPLRVAAQ
jgi:ubiquinone/menaquinone biosynthesis C-methylase UbiE